MNQKKFAPGVVVFGFDSAWSNKNKGAVCALEINNSGKSVSFTERTEVNFNEAAVFIKETSPEIAQRLVAIDQPLIVKNQEGARPVDRTAASVVSYVGGGVQPANRSKKVFNDSAPIWEFLKDTAVEVNFPDDARKEFSGMLGVEVFPALTLTGLNPKFAEKKTGHPKYNPRNKKKFCIKDWQEVCKTVEETAKKIHASGLAARAKELRNLECPRKKDQDRLDAMICAIAGYLWLICDDSGRQKDVNLRMAMIGDTKTGYMVTPVADSTESRLRDAAKRQGTNYWPPER